MNTRVGFLFAGLFLAFLVCLSAFAADPAKPVDLSGKVLDKAGQPIANVEVILFSLDPTRPEASKTVASARSAADGAFGFPASLNWPDAAKGRLPRYYVIANDANQGLGFAVITSDDKTADVAVRLNGKQTTKVTVTGPDGKPVAGATVLFSGCSPKAPSRDFVHSYLPSVDSAKLSSATTDADGQAEVVVPGDVVCRLVAIKPGYAKSYGTDKISLVPGGTVAGNVTYSDGKPAPNVRVTYSYVLNQVMHTESAATDDKGHYEMKDVAAQGTESNSDGDPFSGAGATLMAEDTSLDIPSSVSANVTVKANETATKDMVLQKNLELSGVVVDATSDKPLPGMYIYVNCYGGAGMSANRMIITDDQGHFRTGVPRGANVQINMNAGNNSKYLLDENRQMGAMGPVQNIQGMTADKKDLKLRAYLIPTRIVTGKVVDAAGSAAANVRIYTDPRLPMVSTSADGSFTLNNAPADRPFAILATTDGRGAAVPVKPDQKEVNIQLQATVDRDLLAATSSGKPVGELSVSAYPIYKEIMWYQANVGNGQTDAAGKFRLKNLIPGVTYQISWSSTAKSPYGMGQTRAEISPDKPDEPIRCNVRTFTNTFTGKVVNSKDEPVAGAQFEFRSQQVFNQQNMGNYYGTRSAADGSFKFENLADGTLDMSVYSPKYRRLHVSLPTNKTDAKIVLHTQTQEEPAQHIVTVYDDKGKPLPDALLTLSFRDRSNGQTSQDTIKTDENGVADLSDLPADDISVVCDVDDYALAAITMQSYEEGQYSITLAKAAAPRQVRVVDDSGKPIANLDLRVSSFSSPNQDGMYGYNNMAQLYNWPQDMLKATGMIQKTDAQGRAIFPKVSYNQYVSLQINSQTYGNQSKDIQPSTSDTIAEIRVSVPGSLTGRVTVKDNTPLDLARYRIQLRPHQSGSFLDGQLRPDGSYSVANVIPGTYTATIMSWDRTPKGQKYKLRGDHTITVESAKSVKMDLELQEGIPVRGRLEYTSQPNANGRPQVGLMEMNGGMLNGVDVAADGTFEYYVSGPGSYQVYYLIPGTNQWENAPAITVPDDKPYEGLVIKAKSK